MPELNVSIVTPSKKIFEGKVEYIGAPGKLGDFGVMPGHENFITVLDVGLVEVQPKDQEKIKFLIVGGYFEVTEDNVFVIADEIVTKEDVDMEKAKENVQKYKNELSSLSFDDANYERVRRLVKKYEGMVELAS